MIIIIANHILGDLVLLDIPRSEDYAFDMKEFELETKYFTADDMDNFDDLEEEEDMDIDEEDDDEDDEDEIDLEEEEDDLEDENEEDDKEDDKDKDGDDEIEP